MSRSNAFRVLRYIGLTLLFMMLAGITVEPLHAAVRAEAVRQVDPESGQSSGAQWRSVVQLGPVYFIRGRRDRQELACEGSASGTVISRDGLILTNYHVVDVEEYVDYKRWLGNVTVLEGKMAVFVTKQPDQPPVATFIADVVETAPELDLAIVRITADLSGKAIDPDSLDMPYVRLGDSDAVEMEDMLRIYGYPGIGGTTITFTRGSVSGFDREEGIEGRAWIKTDATIAGGNSGGAALSDLGEIVGVPTQANVASADAPADCRPIQDTNGDGTVDGRDSCIPVGGFINALRPVNLARGIVDAAMRGEPSGDDGTSATAQDGIRLAGTIVDADTGKPVAGAEFVVLGEGVSWGDFASSADDVLEAVRADRRGRFELANRLERGRTYSVGWSARGYRDVRQDDFEITDTTPDIVQVTLKLRPN